MIATPPGCFARDGVITFDKEMAITRRQFLETLECALGGREYRSEGRRGLCQSKSA